MEIKKTLPRRPLGETPEGVAAEPSRKPSALQHGIESVDVFDGASTGRPLPSALAGILEQQPSINTSLAPQAPLQTPGPFDENVQLPTELPSGNAIDPGLAAFNIGGEGLWQGPNHFGIDLSTGKVSARDLIASVLGIANQASVAPAGGIPAPPDLALYAAGEPGLVDGIISWVKSLFTKDGAVSTATDVALEKLGPSGAGEAMTLLRGPELIQKVTGDAADGLRGVQAFGTETRGTELLKKVDEGSKYVNPDADAEVYLTADQAIRIVRLIDSINIKPSSPPSGDELPETDPTDLKVPTQLDPNPGLRFVTDRNPDLQESVEFISEGQLSTRLSAEGGDPVNPSDEIVPQPPPTEIPGTPRGGGTIP